MSLLLLFGQEAGGSVSAEAASGGHAPRWRNKEDIRRGRQAVGLLPEEVLVVEQAVQKAVVTRLARTDNRKAKRARDREIEQAFAAYREVYKEHFTHHMIEEMWRQRIEEEEIVLFLM